MFKKLFPILLLTFVNIIGFTLLVPVLPVIVEQYAPPEYAGVLYGGLLSSYALFQFLAAPILGSLSDRFGRKPLLFLSQLGTLLSWVVFGIAYFVPEWQIWGISLPLYIIAISRIIDGITGGNVSVANAWVSDSTDREEKVEAFGLLGATFGIGFLIGPALGGLTSSFGIGYLGSVITAFVISLVTLLILKYYLPESLPQEKRDPTVDLNLGRQLNMWKKFTEFRENELVSRLLILRFFFILSFTGYVTLIILFLRTQFSLSAAELGLTMSTIGLFSIFNQVFLIKRVSARVGNVRALFVGISCIALGMLSLPLIPLDLPALSWLPGAVGSYPASFLIVMLSAYVVNLGISLAGTNFKSLVTNSVSDAKQGAIIGLDESLFALGNALTPIIAGMVFVAQGVNSFAAFGLLLTLPIGYFYLAKGSVLPVKAS
jgi:DHA1 family tetracycline resistance protein-like MFS transporter